jgi:ABC-type uncharacterized transport system auxiliary subunit
MSARRFLPFLVAIPFLLAACGLPARSHVPVRYYNIEVAPSPSSSPASRPTLKALAVARLSSPSRYRDRIFYRAKNHAAGYYEYDRWVEPPAELLTRIITRALQDARVARAVARETLLRHADLVLAGEVVRFDTVRDKRQWMAECEIHLVLKDIRTRTVLLAQRFAASHPVRKPVVPIARPKVPAIVEAMNAAVGEVVANATEAVAKTLAALPDKPAAAPE